MELRRKYQMSDDLTIDLTIDYRAVATYFFCNVVDRVRTREDDYRWGKEDACELLMSASDIFRQLSDDEWTEVKATLKERYVGK